MSRKTLNKIVSAILVLVICSTAFIGCVVSAETPTATYTVHDGETIVARDPDGSVEVTFTSSKPFSYVRFLVNDVVYDKWANINENGWLVLSKAELVENKTVMADDGAPTAADIENTVISVSSEFDEYAQDHINSVVVDGDASSNPRYYKELTLKLTLECTYEAKYICQNEKADGELCGWIYDLGKGAEEYGIEPGTWYTDFPNGVCPVCNGKASKFRKRVFSYTEGYKCFIISISNVEMTDRGTGDDSIWTADEKQNVGDVNFIHSCTLSDGGRISPEDSDHYQVNNAKCLYCGKQQYRLVLNNALDFGNKYSKVGNIRSFYADAVSMSYNNDGTVDLNVFIDQSFFVNGRNGKSGDWEPNGIIVTNEQGERFTRFAGETGQAKEDISMVQKEYDGTNAVDVTKEDAAKLGYETDTGLRKFSFNNIPASDIGQKLLITVVGYRDSEKNAGRKDLQYGQTVAYSVADYCYDVINDKALTEASTEDKDVVKALLNYGAAAQQYFSEEAIDETLLPNYGLKGDGGENDERNFTIDFSTITAPTVSATTDEKAYFYGVSAIFRTNPTLKFYFRLTDRNYWQSKNANIEVGFTFKGNNTTVNANQMQNVPTAPTYHAYNFTNIGVMDMYEPVAFSLKVNGTEVQTGSYSLAGFAKLAQTSGDAELADLTKAMLNYGDKITSRYGQ